MTLPEPAHINKYPTPGHYTAEQMLAYGKACAAAEREECAKLCEERGMVKGGEVFATRIRARGTT